MAGEAVAQSGGIAGRYVSYAAANTGRRIGSAERSNARIAVRARWGLYRPLGAASERNGVMITITLCVAWFTVGMLMLLAQLGHQVVRKY
jgi:hypothetical protein